jgi:hypothetical protein
VCVWCRDWSGHTHTHIPVITADTDQRCATAYLSACKQGEREGGEGGREGGREGGSDREREAGTERERQAQTQASRMSVCTSMVLGVSIERAGARAREREREREREQAVNEDDTCILDAPAAAPSSPPDDRPNVAKMIADVDGPEKNHINSNDMDPLVSGFNQIYLMVKYI